ncbi:erythromycin esterase family protein [Sporosarcina ureae]|uniref:erythromycin esterase family protein n=1 Tax=Sporosarcina ureae TaxID=1571 RepID=UPI0028B005F2|nr:erythromycin esterase family protein [Sporosarcina ureae]
MSRKLVAAIKEQAIPLDDPSAFDRLLKEVGDAQIVMIGEASHGTSDFYRLRAEFSKRLIREKSFAAIAVEGDWPSVQRINSYVKGYDGQPALNEMLSNSFSRWPAWMWANEEIAAFATWLAHENEQRGSDSLVGMYGIDLYSLYDSIDEVMNFLESHPSYGADLELAKKAFSCFEPYNRMPEHYALSSAHFTDECITEVTSLLESIRTNEERYPRANEQDLNLTMNALVAKNAEAYYRAMLRDDALSWNIRDTHMAEAIKELQNYYGKDAKIIVWEHNTHIGDASATSMTDHGLTNVGQLIREQYGRENTYAIGFGTYEGTVIAGSSWGETPEEMAVPPARFNTWEGQLHAAGAHDKMLLFDDKNRKQFDEWIGHRAIGVVYNPEFEAYGNFVPSRISERYDAFLYIDRSTALRPLSW